LIAFRLATNREKGEICGGLIASHLLALHGVVPHDLDIQFPLERLDLNSMIQHKFVSSQAWLGNLSYELTCNNPNICNPFPIIKVPNFGLR
jgi:hypothetical protein